MTVLCAGPIVNYDNDSDNDDDNDDNNNDDDSTLFYSNHDYFYQFFILFN